MYHLPYFTETDGGKVLEFIRKHPFAILTGCYNNTSVATQIPLLIEEREGRLFLVGHMMRKQDHHLAFEQNPEVLVLFTGPHTYVSATLYSNPHQGSTWNYMTVHARGSLRFTSDDELVSIMRRLTLFFEGNNSRSQTIFDNLPEEYTRKMLKSIIGFEIEVSELKNVFKLSQNRDEASFHAIVQHLEKGDHDAQLIAGEMKQRASQLFNQ